MSAHADTLLLNARVITLEPDLPLAQAVAVSGDTIRAVGRAAELDGLRGPDTKIIDCQGQTLLPGIIDAHCHLLAQASALTGLDCGPPAIATIADLLRQIRREAEQIPAGQWIRGFGYDHLTLIEGRHPTRWELDRAAPQHPVRLDHRSGHATVLNSRALALAGLHRDTPDPPDGVIDREPASGEPTGLLLEMAAWLRHRLGSLSSPEQQAEGLRRLNRRLLSYGITSVQDAGPNNGPDRWAAFGEITSGGHLDCRVTMMAGAARLAEFTALGMAWGLGDDRLRLGHAKIMLTLTTGTLAPDVDELAALISRCHRAGFPVAIHAIEEEAVAAAASALLRVAASGASVLAARARDRIEHCAECPPDLLELVRRSGAVVVTQPGFLYWNGESYRERVDPALLPYLYPLRLLHQSGVPLAYGSDAPVIDLSPWPGLYSAVTRNTQLDRVLPEGGGSGPEAASDLIAGLSVWDALRHQCRGGAYAEGSESSKGSIRVGKLADLTLVDWDPTLEFLEGLPGTRALLTIIGGRVVWAA